MMKSPKVFYKLKYELALENQDNIFNSLDSNYVKKRVNDAYKMNEYFSDSKKAAKRMLDYFSNNYKSYDKKINLVDESGNKITKEEMIKRSRDISKYIIKSNLWKGFFSFKTDYLIGNISLPDLEKKMALEVFPKFFKKCGFQNIKNMNYQFSIHTDKINHYHIHFSFCEKKPNSINRNNDLVYRRRGKIEQKYQDFLKREIVLTLERDRIFTPILKELNEDIDEFKKYFKPNTKEYILEDIDNIDLEYKIMYLGKLLKQYKPNANKINYGSIKNDELGKEIKKVTREIKNGLFKNSNLDFKLSKAKVEKSLDKLNNLFDKLNKDNNISREVGNNDLVLSKRKYIDSYVINSIINNAYKKVENATKKSKITLDDIIQIVAKKRIIVASDKELKRIALRNYFKGIDNKEKYKMTNEIIRAVKSLNDEMEEYAKEFHELFINDEKGEYL